MSSICCGPDLKALDADDRIDGMDAGPKQPDGDLSRSAAATTRLAWVDDRMSALSRRSQTTPSRSRQAGWVEPIEVAERLG